MGDVEDVEPHEQAGLVLAQLRRLEWASELSEEALQAIAQTADVVQFKVAERIVTFEDGVASVYFVIAGRLHVKVFDPMDNLLAEDWLTRGKALGLFSAGLTDHSHLQAEAAEPTIAIRLRLPELLSLTCGHTDFQLALMRLSANIVRRIYSVDRALPKPGTVGIVHQSTASRQLTAQLVDRLAGLGESVAVAGDEEHWRGEQAIPYFQVVKQDHLLSSEERRRLLGEWVHQNRLLIDLRAQHSPQILEQLLTSAEVVLWCIRPEDATSVVELLRALETDVPKWRDKIRIVWILSNEQPFPPLVPELRQLTARDFKLTFEAPTLDRGRLLSRGLERIVHHLRGIQIGLALGGGAARGMAHLGVLKALEEHGIDVDMIAGTSAGAMTGTVYSAGMGPDYATECFKKDLQLNWPFQHLPGGGYWYLMYKYRSNQFEPMLRKYLLQYHMEQLVIPTYTISVDLVEGEPLVRNSGDAAINILESINLPPLALPLIRSEQALVDGGLLNNVPANVLVGNGCNFVIASSVTAKLEKDFMGIRASAGQKGRRLFSTMQVMMRQYMIQSHSMNSVGVQPADFIIKPDVTSFDLSEFTRADEMAIIGENTTNQVVGQLRRMLSKIDPQLFSGD